MAVKKWAEGRAKELAGRLTNTQAQLNKLLLEVAGTSETSATYWAARQREARRLYEEMRRMTRNFMTANVSVAYDQSIRASIADLKATEFTPKTVHYKDFVKSQVYSQGLDAILGESLSAFANGYLSGQTQFLRLMRYTQQANLTEKQVNQALAGGYEAEATPRGAAKGIRDALLAKIQDGKFITIIDKNGDSRSYTVDAYAELVARTKLIEATTAGVTQATLAAGGDLVQVSVHNTNCEVCAPYEGKVFSLSGTDPDFPAADDLPPYHPQCAHTIDPTFREGMEATGTLDEFIDFSNGDSDAHPTRTSYVPLGDRKLT